MKSILRGFKLELNHLCSHLRAEIPRPIVKNTNDISRILWHLGCCKIFCIIFNNTTLVPVWLDSIFGRFNMQSGSFTNAESLEANVSFLLLLHHLTFIRMIYEWTLRYIAQSDNYAKTGNEKLAHGLYTLSQTRKIYILIVPTYTIYYYLFLVLLYFWNASTVCKYNLKKYKCIIIH